MAFFTSIWLALLASFCIIGAAAQDYSIAGSTIAGTGCAASTCSSATTSDSRNIAVNYDSFTANTGPNYSYDDSRKNCQLTLGVKVPSGYQFAFDKFNHNAVYSLDSGVTGFLNSTYYFQGTLKEGQGTGTFAGPARSGTSALSGELTPLVWSPCGQNAVVGINTTIRVYNGGNTGATGSLTIRSTPSYNFVWRTC